MLAFNSKEPYVWTDNRWIASLSDGTTVFEDKTPNIDSAWIRLKSYLRINNLKVTNLRLEVYGQKIALKSIKEDSEILGYWYSNRIEMLFGSSFDGESISRGIGYIKHQVFTLENIDAIAQDYNKDLWLSHYSKYNGIIPIIVVNWIKQDGSIKEEISPLKDNDLGAIINI